MFEDEPNVPEALLTMDNVVVLPRRQWDGGNPCSDGGVDAAKPRELLEEWATRHAGADAGCDTEIGRGCLVVVAVIGDLHDKPSVWRSRRKALHLLDHLLALRYGRAEELVQPSHRNRTPGEFGGALGRLGIQRRDHLVVTACRVDDRADIGLRGSDLAAEAER